MGPSKISKILIVTLLIGLLFVLFISNIGANASNPERAWSAKTFFQVRSIDTRTQSAHPLASLAPTGLSPDQVRNAYNLSSTGDNVTIAIVDAYDYPTALNDFNIFSAQFGLPIGNFEKHLMPGTNIVDPGWSLEAALDIQWAHAIAPNARILLVEAKSPSFSDLLNAVNYAKNRQDVVAISMSWGGDEFFGQQAYNSVFTSNHGVVFFAASGDNGAGVIWPSASSNVVAVGGTTLNLNINGSVASETAWSGSGGGISAYESMPSYQLSYGINGTGGKRAVPDISYNADPNTGFSVYDNTPYLGSTGWFQVGGTSAGAPQWAAIHAIGVSALNSNLYSCAKNQPIFYFRDILTGSNGGYSASLGYDLVTGLGSPITTNFVAIQNFEISSFIVQDGGSDYTTPFVQLVGGGGSGASAIARVSNGVIRGIVLTSQGLGYNSAPSVVFNDPNPRAKGATATAIMIPSQ